MSNTNSLFNTLEQVSPEQANSDQAKTRGFGTITGVFVPSVTMMLGVILFLRLGTIVGHMGAWQFALIIAISLAVMVTTSFSIAMIATNMEVGKGGIYYLISRSLGKEIGGAIGIAICVSQLVCLALCTSAFAYSVVLLFPNISIETVKITTLAVITIISMISVNLVIKTQFGILIILLTAVLSIFFGSSNNMPLSESYPQLLPKGLGFWEAFAIFFPAMTGIEAGLAMSGNLKNPSRSLSLGSIYSLLTVGVIYLILGLFLHASVPADVLKNIPHFLINFAPILWVTYIGIWAAALSSSIGSLMSGPRMLQSLAEDRIVPKILGKGYGIHNEPRYAIALVFVLAMLLMLFTTMDQIIPVLTMICLISYGALNFVAAIAQLINNPSWRPSFRVHWCIPMFGALCALFLMFMIDAAWTFIALGTVLAIYLLLCTRKLEVSFPDIRESIIYYISRFALYRLASSVEHPLNWHPQILACTGAPSQQLPMLQLAFAFTSRSGILTTASILADKWENSLSTQRTKSTIKDFLRKKGIRSLVEVCVSKDIFEGISELIRSYGIGLLQPNTILMGMPERDQSMRGLLTVIRNAHLYKKNLILFSCSDKTNPVSFKKLKSIEIWWESSYTESFELMLSFVDALKSGTDLKNAIITLKVLVNDQKVALHMQDYFQKFIEKIRMKMKLEVVIISENNKIISLLVKESSSDLIVIPLLPLGSWPNGDENNAIEYLKELSDVLPIDKHVALITCYDDLEHGLIYAESNRQ